MLYFIYLMCVSAPKDSAIFVGNVDYNIHVKTHIHTVAYGKVALSCLLRSKHFVVDEG